MSAFQAIPSSVPMSAPAAVPTSPTVPSPIDDAVPTQTPDSNVEDTTHDPLSPHLYGNNTPTKRSTTSGVWNEVKRVKPGLNNADNDATHVCLVALGGGGFCNELLKLHRTPASSHGTRTGAHQE